MAYYLSNAQTQQGSISDLSVFDSGNASSWTTRTNLQVGDVVYGDRSNKFTKISPLVVGSDWIRVADLSKHYEGDTLATFNVNKDVVVYVAHNDRITVKPNWLSLDQGWTNTGIDLLNDIDPPDRYTLFAKNFTSGTVYLGPNGDNRSGMYTIIVVPDASTINSPTPQTASPTPTLTLSPTVTSTSPTLPACSSMAGDVNADNIVDILDIAEIVIVYLQPSTANFCADLNGDGIINILDIVIVIENYSK